MGVQVVAVREFHDLAQVHHGHAVAHVAHDGEIVGDEDDRQPELALKVTQQVQDLRLDRDVEGRDGFVGDDQLGIERKGAGDADALALAARELVREAVVVLGVEPDLLHQLLDLRLQPAARLAVVEAVDAERLADDRADRLARVERRVRVLEDHLHLATERLELALERPAMSRPRYSIVPLVGSSRRVIRRAVVDLPQPVSPTRPSVSPSMMSNDTPSTACTAPIWRWNRIPRVIGKCLTRSRTWTSGSLMPGCPRA